MAQTQQQRPRPQQQRQAPPQDRPQQPQQPQSAPSNGQMTTIAPPRLPYPPVPAMGYYGIDGPKWRSLVESVWPGAKTVEGVLLALDYCRARRLDPMKRPVHIVPIWDRTRGREVESVWPGINEVRTTAARTGLLAGWDPAKYGPVKKANLDGIEMEYPEWAQVTVYRLDKNGNRQAYPGPEIYWREYYATAKRDTLAPNEMWKRKTRFMLWKCAEAAALRAAFPEEIGNEYAAEEMWGKVVDHVPTPAGMQEAPPPRPRREDFMIPESAATVQQQPASDRPQFSCIIVDLDAEEHDYTDPGKALDGIEGILRELEKRVERAKDADERRRVRAALDASAENNAPAMAELVRAGHRDQAQALVDRWHEIAGDLDPFGLKPAGADKVVEHEQDQGPRGDAPDRSPAAESQPGTAGRGAPDFERRWNALELGQANEAIALVKTGSLEDLGRPIMSTKTMQRMRLDQPDNHARVVEAVRQRIAELKDDQRG